MAVNVFGNPVTDLTLKGMPDYANKAVITRTDRAHVALLLKNAESKDVNARTYVENLKKEYGDGVSALCMVYNATGDTIRYATAHDWHGHIGTTPYPLQIANGQWGAFLHEHAGGAAVGSEAAIVYSGKNEAGQGMDWMMAWSIPWGPWYNNKAYCEAREAGHFHENHWDYIGNLLENAGLQRTETSNGCVTEVIIGVGTSPKYEAIMTLTNA